MKTTIYTCDRCGKQVATKNDLRATVIVVLKPGREFSKCGLSLELSYRDDKVSLDLCANSLEETGLRKVVSPAGEEPKPDAATIAEHLEVSWDHRARGNRRSDSAMTAEAKGREK